MRTLIDGKSVRFRQIECCMFDDRDGHLLDIFDSHNGISKGAHLGTINFPTGTSTLAMDDVLAGAVITNSGRCEAVLSGDSMPMHQFTDKRMGRSRFLWTRFLHRTKVAYVWDEVVFVSFRQHATIANL